MTEIIANGVIEHKDGEPYTRAEINYMADKRLLLSKTCVKRASTIMEHGLDSDEDNLSVKELILANTYDIEQDINNVLSFYGAYMDPDVMDKLEKVRKLPLMTYVREIIKSSVISKIGGQFYLNFYIAIDDLKKTAKNTLGIVKRK